MEMFDDKQIFWKILVGLQIAIWDLCFLNEKSTIPLRMMPLPVTPKGFEPISSEPESEILSIELWGRLALRLQK